MPANHDVIERHTGQPAGPTFSPHTAAIRAAGGGEQFRQVRRYAGWLGAGDPDVQRWNDALKSGSNREVGQAVATLAKRARQTGALHVKGS